MMATHVLDFAVSYSTMDRLTDLVIMHAWKLCLQRRMMVLAIENESVGRTRDFCHLVRGLLLHLELRSVLGEH